MAAARTAVELGRRVRVETRTKVRQPLAEAVIHTTDSAALEPLLDIVAEELNVKRVVFAESAERFGRWRAKPNFKALGPRLGSRVQEVAALLARDDGAGAASLARGETLTLVADDGSSIPLSRGDVELSQEVAEGYGVASDGALTVALALELTDALRREGIARELVRLVQDARKAFDLDVGDRIDLGLEATGAIGDALDVHGDDIAAETLAVSLQRSSVSGGHRSQGQVDGERVVVTLRMAVPDR
jgi:isoleucyl-tRNA synthetase